MREINDYMREYLEGILLRAAPITTASNEPREPMSKESLVSVLKQLEESIRAADPLLQRGIPRDYVCVVNPALVPALKAEFDQLPPAVGAMPSSWLALNWLSTLTGRKTWQIPDAPRDRVEYMSELEMYRRYTDYFKRVGIARLRELQHQAMRERRAAADAARQGGQGI